MCTYPPFSPIFLLPMMAKRNSKTRKDVPRKNSKRSDPGTKGKKTEHCSNILLALLCAYPPLSHIFCTASWSKNELQTRGKGIAEEGKAGPPHKGRKYEIAQRWRFGLVVMDLLAYIPASSRSQKDEGQEKAPLDSNDFRSPALVASGKFLGYVHTYPRRNKANCLCSTNAIYRRHSHSFHRSRIYSQILWTRRTNMLSCVKHAVVMDKLFQHCQANLPIARCVSFHREQRH